MCSSDLIRSGKLRALATTDTKRLPALPDVPTVGESVPGFGTAALLTLFTTGGTPPDIVARLNAETQRVLRQADVRERIFNGGGEVVAGTPEEFAATIRLEMAKWGKLIRDAGIRGE